MNGRNTEKEASVINVSTSARRLDYHTNVMYVHAGCLQKLICLNIVTHKARIRGYVWNASKPKSVSSVSKKDIGHVSLRLNGNTLSGKIIEVNVKIAWTEQRKACGRVLGRVEPANPKRNSHCGKKKGIGRRQKATDAMRAWKNTLQRKDE